MTSHHYVNFYKFPFFIDSIWLKTFFFTDRRAKNRLNDLLNSESGGNRGVVDTAVNITSVNARSQAPGPAIIVNIVAYCGTQGVRRIYLHSLLNLILFL